MDEDVVDFKHVEQMRFRKVDIKYFQMEEQNTLIFQDTYTYMSDAHDEMIPLESELVLWWRDSFYSYSFSLMFISEASFSTIFDVLNRGFGVFQTWDARKIKKKMRSPLFPSDLPVPWDYFQTYGNLKLFLTVSQISQ